jgi:hypothetical protein
VVEYGSGTGVIDDVAYIRNLMKKADDEFGQVSVEEGEFSKI